MELTGKTVLFLGSSVTYGSASGGVSFADMMAQELGLHCMKEAVSGTTLADLDETSYVSRLKKLDPATPVDLLICQLSTNDASQGIPLEKTEQAIRAILDYTDRKGASIADPWYTRDFGATYRDIVDGLNGFMAYLGY